jgi:hypothetical protein
MKSSSAGKWIELEIIKLSKISQTQKDQYHIHSIYMLKKKKDMEFKPQYHQKPNKQTKRHEEKKGNIGGEQIPAGDERGKQEGSGENIMEAHCMHI